MHNGNKTCQLHLRKKRLKRNKHVSTCLRIAESVEQLHGNGVYIAKLQYILAIRGAGDLRQLTQLCSVAVSDSVDCCTVGLERLGGRQSTARVDVRVTVSYENHHLNIPDPASPLNMCMCAPV